jgi:Family of unknown function (DUF6236)
MKQAGMPDDALYFPYIEVPDHPSLTRVLLYWDRLGTIVPWSVPELSERMDALVDADLVLRIEPEAVIEGIAGFEEGFLALLNAIGGPKADSAGSLIHRDKATSNLWAELQQRGLAREAKTFAEGGWMSVDSRVGRLYMAYLAKCLARRLGREPITDQRHAFAGFAGGGVSATTLELDRMRALALRGVLPAPSEPVSPRDIADFKAKHWDKLRSFRTHVERRLLEDVQKKDPEIRDRALELTAAELEDGTREIESLMKPRWPSKRGMLCAGLAGTPAGARP